MTPLTAMKKLLTLAVITLALAGLAGTARTARASQVRPRCDTFMLIGGGHQCACPNFWMVRAGHPVLIQRPRYLQEECWSDLARWQAGVWLAAKLGGDSGTWSSALAPATSVPPSILVWRLSYTGHAPPTAAVPCPVAHGCLGWIGNGYLTVTFRATAHVWRAYISQTVTP